MFDGPVILDGNRQKNPDRIDTGGGCVELRVIEVVRLEIHTRHKPRFKANGTSVCFSLQLEDDPGRDILHSHWNVLLFHTGVQVDEGLELIFMA